MDFVVMGILVAVLVIGVLIEDNDNHKGGGGMYAI